MTIGILEEIKRVLTIIRFFPPDFVHFLIRYLVFIFISALFSVKKPCIL